MLKITVAYQLSSKMLYSGILSTSLLITYVHSNTEFPRFRFGMLKVDSSALAGYGCENDQGVVENYLAVCTYAGGMPKPEFQQVVGLMDYNL